MLHNKGVSFMAYTLTINNRKAGNQYERNNRKEIKRL